MHRKEPDERPTFKEMVFDEDLQREWLRRMVRELPCFGVPEWDGRLQVSRHGGSRTGGLHHIGLKYDRDGGMHVEVRADDETVAFELWGDETRWWAAATHAGRGVAVTAVGVSIADIRLARIIDLEPYFAFRDEMMRKMRDPLDDPD
ncbi:hypothetical protein Snas_2919 [Stackebrandtia nassauensis DSM 44728]|uniref:Uncharacterized protein n=1 Tax=Stackebrandtia nassauensis (strain DSM 44728 / CIP 108903 / NRRL B-16338 / NBRC 102104 / LLR-40K-21) TaxID=446470 RepID=D3Q9B2_STANL|nr:hypothetical protein Snas_2919 [Stackebrandtia nassauensis DSM 44728]